MHAHNFSTTHTSLQWGPAPKPRHLQDAICGTNFFNPLCYLGLSLVFVAEFEYLSLEEERVAWRHFLVFPRGPLVKQLKGMLHDSKLGGNCAHHCWKHNRRFLIYVQLQFCTSGINSLGLSNVVESEHEGRIGELIHRWKKKKKKTNLGSWKISCL